MKLSTRNVLKGNVTDVKEGSASLISIVCSRLR